jgi:hypothetical protein
MAKDKEKGLPAQAGVSLIITFFITVIILSVVLSMSVILYSEVKVIRNTGSSVASFYAAESGIEKVQYYERQVVPNGAARGLCSIFNSCPTSGGDPSAYCAVVTAPNGTDCAAATCTSCMVSFSTTFDSRTYTTTATISPDGGFSDLDIKSKGNYPIVNGTQRQIETLTSEPPQ